MAWTSITPLVDGLFYCNAPILSDDTGVFNIGGAFSGISLPSGVYVCSTAFIQSSSDVITHYAAAAQAAPTTLFRKKFAGTLDGATVAGTYESYGSHQLCWQSGAGVSFPAVFSLRIDEDAAGFPADKKPYGWIVFQDGPSNSAVYTGGVFHRGAELDVEMPASWTARFAVLPLLCDDEYTPPSPQTGWRMRVIPVDIGGCVLCVDYCNVDGARVHRLITGETTIDDIWPGDTHSLDEPAPNNVVSFSALPFGDRALQQARAPKMAFIGSLVADFNWISGLSSATPDSFALPWWKNGEITVTFAARTPRDQGQLCYKYQGDGADRYSNNPLAYSPGFVSSDVHALIYKAHLRWTTIKIAWGSNGADLDIRAAWNTGGGVASGVVLGWGWNDDASRIRSGRYVFWYPTGDIRNRGAGYELLAIAVQPSVAGAFPATFDVHLNYYGWSSDYPASAADVTVSQADGGATFTLPGVACGVRPRQRAETTDPGFRLAFNASGDLVSLAAV